MPESVFFFVSKVAWLLAAPTNLMALLVVGGAVLGAWGRTRALGRRATVAGLVALLAAALLPLGDWLLLPLERRFPALGGCSFDGIILLGGSIGAVQVDGAVEEDLNEAADRVRYAATLARMHPDTRILISGGQAFARSGARSEADAMAQMLTELGVARERLLLEFASRTTSENARRTAEAAADDRGRWALVTSAFHMPRAVGAFRKAGMDVIAAPTDWRVDERAPLLSWSASSRLARLDLATKEYVGLLVYRLAGRTDELFPGPREQCADRGAG